MQTVQKAKTIIITGANKGVGYGILENLAQKPTPYRFILGVRSIENGKNALKQLSKLVPDIEECSIVRELDISNSDSIKAFTNWLEKEHGPVDALVNNAGMAFKGDAFDDEVVRITFKTNFYGTIELTEAVLPHINNNGKVVTVGSSAGKFKILKNEDLKNKLDDPEITKDTLLKVAEEFYNTVKDGTFEKLGYPKQSYAMSKLLINLYARVLGKDPEVVKRNIQVYACCPGWVKTDMAGDKAPRTIQEGSVCPSFLVELPWEIKKDYQGKFFYDCVVTSL